MKRSSLAWLAFASLLAAWSLPVHGARPRYGGTLRVEIQSVSLELDPAASPADPLAATAARRLAEMRRTGAARAFECLE